MVYFNDYKSDALLNDPFASKSDALLNDPFASLNQFYYLYQTSYIN